MAAVHAYMDRRYRALGYKQPKDDVSDGDSDDGGGSGGGGGGGSGGDGALGHRGEAALAKLVSDARTIIEEEQASRQLADRRRALQEEIFKCGRSEEDQEGGTEAFHTNHPVGVISF